MTPERLAALAVFQATMERSMPPEEVAGLVFEAIRKEQFYILSHPEWMEAMELRTSGLLRMENPQSPVALVGRLIQGRV